MSSPAGPSPSPLRRSTRNSRRLRSGPPKQRACIWFVTELAQSFRHMDVVTWDQRHGHFTIHDQRRFEQILAGFYGVAVLTPMQLRNIRRQFCRHGYQKTRLSENSFRLTLRQYSNPIDKSHPSIQSGAGSLRRRSYSF